MTKLRVCCIPGSEQSHRYQCESSRPALICLRLKKITRCTYHLPNRTALAQVRVAPAQAIYAKAREPVRVRRPVADAVFGQQLRSLITGIKTATVNMDSPTLSKRMFPALRATLAGHFGRLTRQIVTHDVTGLLSTEQKLAG